MTNTTTTLLEKIMHPINELISSNPYARHCPKQSDQEFVSLGIRRVLGDDKSGCAFLQRSMLEGITKINKSDLFDSLSSKRRLNHLTNLNHELNLIANTSLKKNDVFSQFKELDGFDIYASDGSYYKWACHDEKFIGSAKKNKGKVNSKDECENGQRKKEHEQTKRSCQHFYSCNLRTMIMLHLTIAFIGGDIQKEHDMHALKRLSVDVLRFKAPKKRKVLHVYDRAGFDYHQWNSWKKSAGIYFLSMEKSNSKMQTIGQPNFVRTDMINAGVISDEIITNGNGYPIRRITYECPETGKTYRFITNLPSSIRPGLIAFLYKTRWDVEKQFDVFKNKLDEKKAWATSDTAKTIQANFICLANNLALLLNQKIEVEENVIYTYDKTRKKKKLISRENKIVSNKLNLPFAWKICLRTSQLTVKFFRWIRAHLYLNTSWKDSVESLEVLYAMN